MARPASVADPRVAGECERNERLSAEERVQEALALGEQGVEVEIRVAEPGDPLAGVVRISSGSALTRGVDGVSEGTRTPTSEATRRRR